MLKIAYNDQNVILFCLQVYISSSGKYSDTGHPFGYLKASSALTCVNLFVMPYNYPILLPLLGKHCITYYGSFELVYIQILFQNNKTFYIQIQMN